MNFSSILGYLTSGKAAKRASWAGYIKREDKTVDGSVVGYYIVFVTRAGVQYVYQYTTATGAYTYLGKVSAGSNGALAYATAQAAIDASAVTASDVLDLDPDLFGSFGSSDWTYSDTANYEASRSGSGSLW